MTPVTEATMSGEKDRPHRSRSPRERQSSLARAPTGTRRSGHTQSMTAEERLLAILEEPLARPETGLDECYHYSLSLVPLLLKLDYNHRQQVMIGILKLLRNVESGTTTQQALAPEHLGGCQGQHFSQSSTTFPTPALNPSAATYQRNPPHPLSPIGPFTRLLASSTEWDESTFFTNMQITFGPVCVCFVFILYFLPL